MSWRTEPRMTHRRDSRWWLGAGMVIASAAAAVYFLDPQRGQARRSRIAERGGHAARTAGRRAVRQLHYARRSVAGRLGHFGGEPEPVDGSTLLDRVESELFTDPTIPHGKLTFEVEGQTVILRGQLDSDAEITRVVRAVAGIPGVIQVQSLLHIPGTPAPNKRDALIASANAASEERELGRLD